MQPRSTPRSLPPSFSSNSTDPHNLATSFLGDQSFPSSSNYILAGGPESILQSSSTGNRKSIDPSGEPSRPSISTGSEPPWDPYSLGRPQLAGAAFRTPLKNLSAYNSFSVPGSFRDSGIGTYTGPSHDETQSLMSSSIVDMENEYGYDPPFAFPAQPQEVHASSEGQVEDFVSEEAVVEDDGPETKQKSQRQPRTKEELTCGICHQVARTRSELK
jgi:hypothetical protein